MATKTSQTRSSSPKRDEPTSAGIHLDFEDLLAAAIASVIIKRPKNANLPPEVDRKLWIVDKISIFSL